MARPVSTQSPAVVGREGLLLGFAQNKSCPVPAPKQLKNGITAFCTRLGCDTGAVQIRMSCPMEDQAFAGAPTQGGSLRPKQLKKKKEKKRGGWGGGGKAVPRVLVVSRSLPTDSGWR